MSVRLLRTPLIITALATAAALTTVAPATASSAPRHAAGPARANAAAAARPALVYPHLRLPDGGWAQVYSDGLAEVHRPGATAVKSAIEHLPLLNPDGGTGPAGSGARELPSKGQIIADLVQGSAQPYAAGQVVVIYRPGISAAAIGKAQAGLGVVRSQPMFAGAARQRMLSLHNTAQQKTGRSLLDFPDARVLHVTKTSVVAAVAKLRSSPDVTFAEPNWTVRPTDTPSVPVPAAALRQARLHAAAANAHAKKAATAATASGVPDNFALTSSAQSMLNRPADDVVPAYAALARDYGQLPGQGEIITNVSLGTLDDASAIGNPNDPCNGFASALGPTTEIINGQRYINWPSMPLIPTYTASSSGVLDPTGETCGDDPSLTEIGLDFSMMAPLPHDQQRPGETGSGLTDLLGIAPGASYRLVVPSTPGGLVTNVDAALLAAANQTPRPDVITVSLGFGLDAFGYPDRYLEDDALTESVIASIVANGVVVSCSSGDGLRTATNAAVPPSGGAVATNVATDPSQVTNLNDVADSSAVSVDSDSGAIDAGGSTLNDIFAAPPQNPANSGSAYLQAYPATRYDGGRLYASGFGSRVNVSAPGDNVLSFSHPFGGADDAVTVVREGGTSASAPEAAAAAAVVLQVARLTGDTALTSSPRAVRTFLESSGTPLPAVPQSDTPLQVGPQIDVGHAVEELLAADGQPVTPGVARVAVAQRQQASALGGSILTITDPANISLTGRLSNALVTIAPDWTGLPRTGVIYKLSATTGPALRLAGTPWARLQPAAILAAAGLPLVSASSQNVPLVYTATENGKVVARASFTLTFGPTDGTVPSVPAPIAPPVTAGGTIPVRYDISRLTGDTSPTLVVSHPGRVDPATGLFFRPSYTAALTAPSGTIDVPVSALAGGGIYGIGIQQGPGGWFATNYSAYAFTRISPAGSTAPPPPTLSTGSGPPGHFLEFSYNGSFQLHYDVRNVPGATGAIAEFSAPGPTAFNLYDTFNNPNGSERDNNGHDSPSVAYVPLSGTTGTATLNGGQLGLDPTMFHVVRVLATAHGRVDGEASGVSTINMDGIAAADGGSVIGGFGVDANGNDGFLTSNQITANGAELGSIETFNQVTGATNNVVSSSDFYSTLGGGCAGIYGNDTGVVDDFNFTTQTDTFDTLNPVSGGVVNGTWTPPADAGNIFCAAYNQSSSQSALLSSLNGQLYVTPADFAAGTTGTPIDISPALQSMTIPILGAIAENPATGHAFVAATDIANLNAPGIVVDVDLNSGQVSTFPIANNEIIFGMAVDPTTNTALIASSGGFSIENLATDTSTLVAPGGSTYQFPVWVPGTHDFLVEEAASPDFFGQTPNNNTASSILVIDENGNVVHRYEQFNFFGTFLLDLGAYIQSGSATSSTAITIGPSSQQLHPFTFQTG
ncbi:MAG TPA: hypothetical protein VGS62_00675 [Streptosporangiaceae bacterium]|nr:hypothetical protein [Streptosporangiaceae bacterium]